MTATVIDFATRRAMRPALDPLEEMRAIVQRADEESAARQKRLDELTELICNHVGPSKAAPPLIEHAPTPVAELYRRPIEPGRLSQDARGEMRSLWHERYADMRSAALQWQLTTGQFNTRPYPELWRHDAETQAAFRGYAEAARILLRTPAPLMEALRWKKRSGTPDILPAEEVAAIIAADEAWLEAVNGKKRLARIARH